MAAKMRIHEGVIRPGLVEELGSFRAPPGGRVTSYYLNLNRARDGGGEDRSNGRDDEGKSGDDDRVARRNLKDTLARERKRIEQRELPHEARRSLLQDWELVEELAMAATGDRYTLALACFVASGADYSRALRLAWPVRDRAFFEDRFVLWPLQQVLDQSDRYAICLTDRDEARLFLYYLGQIEEVKDIIDEVPERVRFPDPYHELEYTRKITERAHHHFHHVAEQALRLLRREPFEHLIIGGLWTTSLDFESRLHRYLRDRIVARWDVDVHKPIAEIRELARGEEQRYVENEAREVWKAIRDQLPHHGALGPRDTLAALWQRRVQWLLEEPGVSQPGFRCSACGRLNLTSDPCVECGGKMIEVPDLYEEAVHDAADQSAHVRYWKDPALNEADSMAAYKRF
jgi:peptide subunit release factor 1 (eRF1)